MDRSQLSFFFFLQVCYIVIPFLFCRALSISCMSHHSRWIEFAVPLKINWHFSWLGSPPHQPTRPPWHNRALGTASPAITDHPSQFLMLKKTQKQTKEWDSKNCCHGGEVNWWKNPQTTNYGISGGAGRWVPEPGRGWTPSPTQWKKKVDQSLVSIQLRCALTGWIKTNLWR